MAALADLPALAARISGALTAAEVPHAISGAMAMSAHGFVRATRGIDVLVVVPSVRLPGVFSLIRGFGFSGDDAALIRDLREQGVAELRSGPASVEILRPVLPYHADVLRRAVRMRIEGIEVPFVTAEDLVVLKLLWLRDKDRADIRAMLAARRRDFDLEYVRRTLASLLPDADPRHGLIDSMVGEASPPG